MVEFFTSIRTVSRRLWRRWRSIIVVSGLVLVVATLAVMMRTIQDWQADRRYQAAVADADRLDPTWRLDQLLARREKVPDDVSSTLRVHSIVDRFPAGWPGIIQFDTSFDSERGTPEVRLDKVRIDQLREVCDPVAGLATEARSLSDYPRGNLEEPRPRVEQYEQVGGLNASIDIHFPYGEKVRRVVFLLWLDAKLLIEAGDLETAMVDVRAMINAGRSIGDYPGLSAQMTRAGVRMGAIPCLESTLAQGEARASSLAAVQSLLEDESRQPLEMIALRGDRAITDDLLQQIHSGKLGFNAIPGFSDHPFWIRALGSRVALRQVQATLLRFHSRAVEVGGQPETEQIDSMKALNDEWVRQATSWGFLEGASRLPERLLLGRVGGAPTWFGMDQALIRTAIAALAAERYRLARGRWPETLDQLVPNYLGAVPSDPLARGPLKLHRLRDGLFVYSVGFDRRDDGGKIDWQVRGRPNSDQGFRLWDVDCRRRPAGGPPPSGGRAGDSTARPDQAQPPS